METSKPKSIWIYKGTSGFADELGFDDEGNPCKIKPEGFYDLISESDFIEGGAHFVEYSAYEEAMKRVEELTKEINDHEAEWNAICDQNHRADHLESQNKKLIEALEKYADPNYHGEIDLAQAIIREVKR